MFLRQPQVRHRRQEGSDHHHASEGSQVSRRQLDKKERIFARLHHRITDLEETIHERDMQLEERETAGEDLRGDPYSYISDDDEFLEDQAMDFFTDEDDFALIDDDDEDDEDTNSEE